MANKNKQRGSGKQVKMQSPQAEGRKCKAVNIETLVTIVIGTISILVSVFALVVSIGAANDSKHFSEMEYFYKIDPQIVLSGTMEIQKGSVDEKLPNVGISEIILSVTEKNNLDQAHIIYADERVEKLELENLENILEDKIQPGLEAKPDMTIGIYKYKYFFVYLQSLDGGGNLHLLYVKTFPASSDVMGIDFRCVSGIEVYGLGKGTHENPEEYEGELRMAQEYARIIKELPNFIP